MCCRLVCSGACLWILVFAGCRDFACDKGDESNCLCSSGASGVKRCIGEAWGECSCQASDGGGPSADGSPVVPDIAADSASSPWSCAGNAGARVCTNTDADELPLLGTQWRCHFTVRDAVTYWICVGKSHDDPSGGGWACSSSVFNDSGFYRCERPVTTESTPDTGSWACIKSSEIAGTRCDEQEEEPAPVPFLEPNQRCSPGKRVWCDGLEGGAWGQVVCSADGMWPTRVVNGRTLLDCMDLERGTRPNTACACYHSFFNPDCCERADCVVVDEQLCADGGAGGTLCDFCNAVNPGCTGGTCITNNTNESFCGLYCATTPCPSGFTCMDIKTPGGMTKQCVPADLSCYYLPQP